MYTEDAIGEQVATGNKASCPSQQHDSQVGTWWPNFLGNFSERMMQSIWTASDRPRTDDKGMAKGKQMVASCPNG